MANTKHYPSYTACVAQALSTAPGPLSMDELTDQVGRQRPLSKNARSAIYQAISKLYQAIPVSPGQYVWLSAMLKDSYFRHPLDRVEIQYGYLLLDELEHAVFFPEFFQAHKPDSRIITISLMGGPLLDARAEVERGTWSLYLGPDFSKWVEEVGGNARDDLLVRVEDAVTGRYVIRLQPHEVRQQELIERRNQDLAEMTEALVISDRKLRLAMPTWELAARLVGKGFYAHPVPPDDLHYVLHEYSSLRPYGNMGYTANGEGLEPADEPDEEASSPAFDLFFSEYGDDPDPDLYDEPSADDRDMCEAYQAYLDAVLDTEDGDPPLSHSDYHLLEAELEMLVSLEQEFGYLMLEQERRKRALAEQLFIDLDLWYGNDLDMPGYEDPPFWKN